MKPSDLLRAAEHGVLPVASVSIDTETSGLYVDSGARVSTVSVAWHDEGMIWREYLELDGASVDRFQEIGDGYIVTWDTEQVTEGGWLVPVVSMAWAFDQGVEGTGKPEDKSENMLWHEDSQNLGEAEWRALLRWLAIVGPKVGLDMHHAKFDMHMMQAGTRRWPDTVATEIPRWVVWDTQNVADLLWAGRYGTTSLKPTSARLWGDGETGEQAAVKEYLKKRKLPSGRWDLMPWDVIAKYADDDARKTCRLKLRQMHDLEHGAARWLDGKDGRMTWREAVERRLATSKMLQRVERRGLPFDVPGAREASAEVGRRIEAMAGRLPFSPPTINGAIKYWHGPRSEGGLGLTPDSVTGTGKPQLNQQNVKGLVKRGIHGAEDWQTYQALIGAKSRWYDGWTERAGADGRLRTSIRQNGTVSGRFSVENIQLQAIPHDYKLGNALREVPTPRTLIGQGAPAGWELWELDLAQAELRVAAMFAKCRRMLELINAGADLHGETAKEVIGVKPGDDDWDQMRTVSKRMNFGLIFGIGAEKFKDDVEEQAGVILSLQEAKDLVSGWHGLYPEFRQAIQSTEQTIKRRMAMSEHGLGYGWITARNGERRWFTPDEVDSLFTKGFNQRVQANLAQFGTEWWLESERYLERALGDSVPGTGGVGMVLMVHDSQVLLLPEGEHGEHLAQTVVQMGVDLWSEWFPGVPGGVDAKRWTDKG